MRGTGAASSNFERRRRVCVPIVSEDSTSRVIVLPVTKFNF